VTVTADDGNGYSGSTTFKLVVAPVVTFDHVDDQTAAEGMFFTVPVTGHDAHGDTLTYSLSGQPVGVTMNTATGEVFGAPAVGTAGHYVVTVTAKDLNGFTNSISFNLDVTA